MDGWRWMRWLLVLRMKNFVYNVHYAIFTEPQSYKSEQSFCGTDIFLRIVTAI